MPIVLICDTRFSGRNTGTAAIAASTIAASATWVAMTAGSRRNSSGIRLISRVDCHVETAALRRRLPRSLRCATSATAMINVITTGRAASLSQR